MNAVNELFLQAVKAALRGENTQFHRDLSQEEWQAFFSLAGMHRMLPLVYQAVYGEPSLKKENPAMVSAVRRQVWGQMMLQTQKTSSFLELNRILQDAGVKPLVVKGIICRNLYPQPDCRESGDEDVLITEEQFDVCHQAMVSYGMVSNGTREAYEVPYRKADSPLYIELHKQLFPPESNAYGDLNRFFAGVHERAIPEEIQGCRVYTMDCTDHLFYLICHSFKHFLHSGFGIRQVCDIVLYAECYGEKVDWEQVLKNCREIRADHFAAAIFEIGRNHLGFIPEKAAYPRIWREIAVDERPMLEDLLTGGLYGDSQMARKHSSNITLSAVSAHKMGKKAEKSALTSVFPPARNLEQRYPYLKNHPYLVPVAWCDRLWKYAWETKEIKNNSAADALKIGSKRVGLLKEYGIID